MATKKCTNKKPKTGVIYTKTVFEKLRETLPNYNQLEAEASFFVDIAIMIAEMREKKGLTQAELAKTLKTDQSVISKIERGKANITLGRLFELVEALDAKLQMIISWK